MLWKKGKRNEREKKKRMRERKGSQMGSKGGMGGRQEAPRYWKCSHELHSICRQNLKVKFKPEKNKLNCIFAKLCSHTFLRHGGLRLPKLLLQMILLLGLICTVAIMFSLCLLLAIIFSNPVGIFNMPTYYQLHI